MILPVSRLHRFLGEGGVPPLSCNAAAPLIPGDPECPEQGASLELSKEERLTHFQLEGCAAAGDL